MRKGKTPFTSLNSCIGRATPKTIKPRYIKVPVPNFRINTQNGRSRISRTGWKSWSFGSRKNHITPGRTRVRLTITKVENANMKAVPRIQWIIRNQRGENISTVTRSKVVDCWKAGIKQRPITIPQKIGNTSISIAMKNAIYHVIKQQRNQVRIKNCLFGLHTSPCIMQLAFYLQNQ